MGSRCLFEMLLTRMEVSVLVVIRKKSFRFIVSLSVFYVSWCFLASYSIACSLGPETSTPDHKLEETTLVKDRHSELPGRSLEKAFECHYPQSDTSGMKGTVVLSRPKMEKPPLCAFPSFVSETHPSFHPFSNVTARVSVEPSADPDKLYLQNQSFLC